MVNLFFIEITKKGSSQKYLRRGAICIVINNDNVVDNTTDNEEDYEADSNDDDLNNNIMGNNKTDFTMQDDLTKHGSFLKDFWNRLKTRGFRRKKFKRNRTFMEGQ